MGNLIGIIAIGVLSMYVFYLVFLQNNMEQIARITGKSEQVQGKTGFEWILSKLEGWKTIVLAAISGGVQILSLVDPTVIQNLPWNQVVDPRTANIISFICALLIPLTHASGKLNAAKVIPQE